MVACNALHQVQVLHQRDRPVTTAGCINRAVDQQPLVAVGPLTQAAAQGDATLQQPQHRTAGFHLEVEVPGIASCLWGLHHLLNSPAPAGWQAAVGMEHQGPVMACSGHPFDQLLPPSPFLTGQCLDAGQGGRLSGGIPAVPIHDDHLGPIGPAGQIGQQQWQPTRFIQRRNQDGQPCHRLRSRR